MAQMRTSQVKMKNGKKTMKSIASKKAPQKKEKSKNSRGGIHEKIIELQQKQLDFQMQQEERHEKFMREMMKAQQIWKRRKKRKREIFFLNLDRCYQNNIVFYTHVLHMLEIYVFMISFNVSPSLQTRFCIAIALLRRAILS